MLSATPDYLKIPSMPGQGKHDFLSIADPYLLDCLTKMRLCAHTVYTYSPKCLLNVIPFIVISIILASVNILLGKDGLPLNTTIQTF